MRERGVDNKDISPASVDSDDIKIEAEQPQDVTSNRADNVWEENTTGYTLFVTVTTSKLNPTAGETAGLIGHINTEESNNVMAESQIHAHDTTSFRTQITMVVPQGAFYKVNVIGTAGLDRWHEQKIGVP